MATQTLHGSCACGRNRYVIEMPKQQIRQAELRYDNTSASRKYMPCLLCGRVSLDGARHGLPRTLLSTKVLSLTTIQQDTTQQILSHYGFAYLFHGIPRPRLLSSSTRRH